MSLQPGARLGAYEIVAAIGAGGMGEVYRARDTNLERDVAVKILPEAVAADVERLARLEREARVLASLNHPNIAAIYGLERMGGATALVMELAPGDTLAARLARGRVPADEAVPIALQITRALEAAHEKGIIHRDLKPANVVVSPDGKVKVLDFGLAKLADGSAAAGADAANLSLSPTIPHAGTMAGVLLGTAAYMSPEQARGKAVDKRTDIWAFGCVLFEMLAGRQAFPGETLTDIVAAVVKNEPDWTTLPPDAPAAARSVLARCLRKDPAQRLHDVADARIELERAFDDPLPRIARGGTAARAAAIPWILVTVLAIALAGSWLAFRRTAVGPLPVMRLELNMPAGVEAATTNTPNIAISPDGTRLAYTGGVSGLRRVYIRRLDQYEETVLRGTETVNACAFSPDGKTIAFITSDRTLKKVSIADGLVSTIAPEVDYQAGGVDWGADDRITFVRLGNLWQVPASGGTAKQLTTPDADKNGFHSHPFVLPSGKAILFASVSGGDRTSTRIEALSVETGRRRTIVEAGGAPAYSRSGHLIFFRGGALLAAPFDPERVEVTGPTFAVLDDLSLDQLGNPMIAFSSVGMLAYVPSANATKRLVWVSRRGVEEPITDRSRPYQNPRISPDQQRIVVEIAGGDLWLHDSARSTFTRLTTGETAGNTFAVWTPDGRRIVFRTLTGIRTIDADGGGTSKMVAGTSVTDIPSTISPDGQTLAFIRQVSSSGGDIYVMSLATDSQPHAVVKTPGYDGGAQFSPDGRWMAYVTNESGQFEVYVRPYPEPDRKIQVSTNGGTHPKWNANGKELFYRSGNKMMAVDVSLSRDLTLSQPRVLFEQRYVFGSAQTIPNYDVSADGQRFLMVKDDSASGRLNIVLNWFDELKRLAPSR
jgi:eukaryotic-like serine/threonine-protein kinase